MFMIILVSVLRHGNNKDDKEPKLKKLLKRAVITFVLLIMFGVGWIFGVLGSTGVPDVIGIASQFTFIFVIGFQGLLIFLLHPCRSKDARLEWKRWFYYLTCRVQKYQDLLKQSVQSKGRSVDNSGVSKNKTGSSGISSSAPRGTSPYGGSNSGASKYGYNRRKSNESNATATIASRFGYNPGGRRPSDVKKVTGDLLTIPGTGTGDMSSSRSYASDIPGAIVEGTIFEDGASSNYDSQSNFGSGSESPSSQLKSKANLRQMFVFDNRTDELLTFDQDSNADTASQFGNVVEFSSDLMSFSPESDSIAFANQNAQNEESGDNFTWQTYEYDDENQTGAATIFYNFEDDSS